MESYMKVEVNSESFEVKKCETYIDLFLPCWDCDSEAQREEKWNTIYECGNHLGGGGGKKKKKNG